MKQTHRSDDRGSKHSETSESTRLDNATYKKAVRHLILWQTDSLFAFLKTVCPVYNITSLLSFSSCRICTDYSCVVISNLNTGKNTFLWMQPLPQKHTVCSLPGNNVYTANCLKRARLLHCYVFTQAAALRNQLLLTASAAWSHSFSCCIPGDLPSAETLYAGFLLTTSCREQKEHNT
jgi:hypothetical protein